MMMNWFKKKYWSFDADDFNLDLDFSSGVNASGSGDDHLSRSSLEKSLDGVQLDSCVADYSSDSKILSSEGDISSSENMVFSNNHGSNNLAQIVRSLLVVSLMVGISYTGFWFYSKIRKSDKIISAQKQKIEMSSLERRLATANRKIQELKDDLITLRYAGRVQDSGFKALEIKDSPLTARFVTVQLYGRENPSSMISALSTSKGNYVIEVDKPEQRIRIWERVDYRLVAESPISTGINKGPKRFRNDGRTPEHYFTIASVHDARDWLHDGVKGEYGSLFYRLNFGSWDKKGDYDPDGHCSIGIHGTDQPERLGGRASEGCIRLPNEFLLYATDKGYLAKGVVGYIVPDSVRDDAVYGADSSRISTPAGVGMGYDRLPVGLSSKASDKKGVFSYKEQQNLNNQLSEVK